MTREECTLGYFPTDEGVMAGKNKEPGRYHVDALAVKGRAVGDPSLVYVDLSPWEGTGLGERIDLAAERDAVHDLDELGVSLYTAGVDEPVPPSIREEYGVVHGPGVFPGKPVGTPNTPVKPVYLLPADLDPWTGDYTRVENISHNKLSEAWGGVNEHGLTVYSAAIRHDDRYTAFPPYARLVDHVLASCKTPDDAVNCFNSFTVDHPVRAGNFLIGDEDTQLIIEYLSPGLADDDARMTVTERRRDFRTNFASESGMFKRPGWDIESAQGDEVHHYLRSVNRQLACQEGEDAVEDVFMSHRFYPGFREREVVEEAVDRMKHGELDELQLGEAVEYPSFYTACTHPEIDRFPWDGRTPTTFKRTQWSWIANLTAGTSRILYDNPCNSEIGEGGGIQINVPDIEEVVRRVA